jgi:hypothetical protein
VRVHFTKLGLAAFLAAGLCGAGCVRRAGRNSDCRWPAETAGAADARHLSSDAELAEDLAIRYADLHNGLRTPYYVSGAVYDAARDACMQTLFAEVARTHGVSAETVAGALGRNRAAIDIAIVAPFVLLYCGVTIWAARALWRRYPPVEDGWMPGAFMILFLSVVFAGGSALLGELWCLNAETIRVGNSHMSYRVQRLWWTRHRTELFAGGVLMFWVAGAASARGARIKEGGRLRT